MVSYTSEVQNKISLKPLHWAPSCSMRTDRRDEAKESLSGILRTRLKIRCFVHYDNLIHTHTYIYVYIYRCRTAGYRCRTACLDAGRLARSR
jgi:hypothetical protein